jgi:type IV pilus assembly protein PilO
MALDIKKGLGSVTLPTIPWGKLSKLTRIHKLLISVVVLGVLWGCFVWFLYLPQKDQLTALGRDIRSADAQLDQLRRVEKNLRNFKSDYKETEIKFKQALQLLPDKEEIPSLLASISSLGAESGLEFLLFQPQKDIPRNFYAEIPLKLEVAGPFQNVAVFFDRVSRLSRIVNIGDVDISTMKAQGDEIILKTGCTATTYKFIEAKPEAKPRRGKRGGG